MTIVYSDDDTGGSRWSGVGRLLTAQEVNYNFYQHETRLAAVEASITVTVSIDTITQPTPTTLLFTMTDSSTQGPFTLPTATFQDRGTWQPSTAYLVNDTFTANGSLYRVLFDHTSASTFSPTANDGAGNDYYAAMLSDPGNALPAGGATDSMLKKSSGTDYAVTWGFALPNGGTTGQALLKSSNSDQAFGWSTITAAIVSFSPPTGSPLTSTNVADALEELSSRSTALANLSDVQFSTGQPDTGDLLQFNGSDWVPVTLTALRNSTVTALLGGASTDTIDPSLGDVFTLTPFGDITIEASSAPVDAEITLLITTSGTSSYTMTFGTGITSQGTLTTGTVTAKVFAIKFVGNGTNLIEVSRTTAM